MVGKYPRIILPGNYFFLRKLFDPSCCGLRRNFFYINVGLDTFFNTIIPGFTRTRQYKQTTWYGFTIFIISYLIYYQTRIQINRGLPKQCSSHVPDVRRLSYLGLIIHSKQYQNILIKYKNLQDYCRMKMG